MNFDVVRLDSGARVLLRTWEKGVERETLACGSAAVAAAALARLRGGGSRIEVLPASGVPLLVDFDAAGRAILSGEARVIFDGRLDTEAACGFPDP